MLTNAYKSPIYIRNHSDSTEYYWTKFNELMNSYCEFFYRYFHKCCGSILPLVFANCDIAIKWFPIFTFLSISMCNEEKFTNIQCHCFFHNRMELNWISCIKEMLMNVNWKPIIKNFSIQYLDGHSANSKQSDR